MDLVSLQGKVALVTGASSGIGAAAARALAEEGVQVVLAARSREKLDEIAASIGHHCLAVPTDVGNPGEVAGLFQVILDRYGGLDLLFNNAGVGYHGPFEKSNPTEWRQTIDANLYGVLYCTQAAIPLLRGRPGAMISTVASVGGRFGVEGWAVYSATKFAVVGFHEALRKELGPDGIRLNLIEPGAVYTRWGHNVPAEAMQERRDKVNALHAADIARALVFAFHQPANVDVREILVTPTLQTYP